MSSVRKEEKRVAKRRQVYKPILENPFTNEGKYWPHVNEQKLVLELLEEKVLKKWKLLHEMKSEPEEQLGSVILGFNDIVRKLSDRSENPQKYMLFVCKKDNPAVLSAQIPILCETSVHDVLLVQLPRLSLAKFDDACGDKVHDGICLVQTNPHFQDLGKLVANNVEPLDIPWLHSAQCTKTPVKLLRTTAPVVKKNPANKTKTKTKT